MWRMRPPSSWTWHLPSAHGFGGSCAMKKARGWAAPPAALASFSAMIRRFFTLTMRTSLECFEPACLLTLAFAGAAFFAGAAHTVSTRVECLTMAFCLITA